MRLVRQKNTPPRWYFTREEVILLDRVADRERLRWEEVIQKGEDRRAAANFKEDLVWFYDVVCAFDEMVNNEEDDSTSTYLAFQLNEAASLLKALNVECRLLYQKKLHQPDIDKVDEDPIDPVLLRNVRDGFSATAEIVFGDELYRQAYYNRS